MERMKERSGAANRRSPTSKHWKNVAEMAGKLRAETPPLGNTEGPGDRRGVWVERSAGGQKGRGVSGKGR